jgi:hypothetical protein
MINTELLTATGTNLSGSRGVGFRGFLNDFDHAMIEKVCDLVHEPLWTIQHGDDTVTIREVIL